MTEDEREKLHINLCVMLKTRAKRSVKSLAKSKLPIESDAAARALADLIIDVIMPKVPPPHHGRGTQEFID